MILRKFGNRNESGSIHNFGFQEHIYFSILFIVMSNFLNTVILILKSPHEIVLYIDSIIYALLNAANSSIPFTRPHYKYYKPKIVDWNVYVKPFFVEALRWNKIWKGR